MKELLIVSVGSFLGGGLRYAVSRGFTLIVETSFPFATFLVNILGCLFIGFFSGLPQSGSSFWGLRPETRLLLTTGLCGGFTTFSTFMKESQWLAGRHSWVMAAYIVLSLVLGFAAVWGGQHLAKPL